MKTTLRVMAVSIVSATLMATSLFADNRHLQTTYNDNYGRSGGRNVMVEGRIRDIDRDRNGFVIRLDRSNAVLFAPVQTEVRTVSSRNRTRVRDLRRGDSIRAVGNYDRRGTLQVRSIELVRDSRRRVETLTATVEAIDDRRGVLWVRDRLHRSVAVDARDIRNDRHGNLRNLRRGDLVVITGEWLRNGEFEAHRIELARR
jgi:hypothetical protein